MAAAPPTTEPPPTQAELERLSEEVRRLEEETRQLKQKTSLFKRIRNDVSERVKSEAHRKLDRGSAGNVLSDMFRTIPSVPDLGADVIEFATALKGTCLISGFDFKDVVYANAYRIMCASTFTPAPPSVQRSNMYAIVTSQDSTVGMTKMICEGITAILSRRSVRCSKRSFSVTTNTFNTEEFRSQPANSPQHTSVVFTPPFFLGI
jgi:hypothetical protein